MGQKEAFQTIKTRLASIDTLIHYDPKRETIIAANAYQSELGEILFEVDVSGNLQPVCYASKSLPDHKVWYAVIEKEALAVL